jgi:Zn ribbon nucleic-acid-binding protein
MIVEEGLSCVGCGYEYATLIINKNGKRTTQVHDNIELKVNKKENLASVTCLKCGVENKTDINFWKRF